jgi:hypothetical protein
MDVLAHALWAGAGVTLARKRWLVSPRIAALAVALAVAPDLPHLLPIVGWSLLGDGTLVAITGYAYAIPGREPALPPLVQFWSHHLHCITHSAIVAALVTLLVCAWWRSLWVPLLGWWSHIVIDVFTIRLTSTPRRCSTQSRASDSTAWRGTHPGSWQRTMASWP